MEVLLGLWYVWLRESLINVILGKDGAFINFGGCVFIDRCFLILMKFM